jgi:hypothetical protein
VNDSSGCYIGALRGPGDRYEDEVWRNTRSSRPSGTAISIRAGRDVREEVESLKLHIGIALRRTSASHFVALVLPMLPPTAPSLGTLFFGIITIPIPI